MVSATLSGFHTASPDNNPFTIYVVTVKKDGAQWQVFRRYREWEDLRTRLIQQLGSAPPMPPKQLFGRMRPEVIENRILGLSHFLQLCVSTPMYASHRALDDFLCRQKNTPPEGLDPSLIEPPLYSANDGGGQTGGGGTGVQRQQLQELVLAASQAFIPVSQEAPPLDPVYLAERSRMFASAAGTKLPPDLTPGATLSLTRPVASGSNADDAAAAVSSAIAQLLEVAAPSVEETALLEETSTAAGAAMASMAAARADRAPVVLDL